jgi:hypothetical protein
MSAFAIARNSRARVWKKRSARQNHTFIEACDFPYPWLMKPAESPERKLYMTREHIAAQLPLSYYSPSRINHLACFLAHWCAFMNQEPSPEQSPSPKEIRPTTPPSTSPPAVGSSKPCKTSPAPGSAPIPPLGATGGRSTLAASCGCPRRRVYAWGPWFPVLHPANFNSDLAISHHPKHLQVIIDLRYQCAIMFSLGQHDSFVPYQPWALAKRFL